MGVAKTGKPVSRYGEGLNSMGVTKNPTYNSPITIIFKSYHPKIKCSLQLQSPSFYVNSNRFQHFQKSVLNSMGGANSMGGPPGVKNFSMGGIFNSMGGSKISKTVYGGGSLFGTPEYVRRGSFFEPGIGGGTGREFHDFTCKIQTPVFSV